MGKEKVRVADQEVSADFTVYMRTHVSTEMGLEKPLRKCLSKFYQLSILVMEK